MLCVVSKKTFKPLLKWFRDTIVFEFMDESTMRYFVEGPYGNTDFIFLIEFFSNIIICKDNLSFGWLLCSGPMLLVCEDIKLLQMIHDVAMDYMLENLANKNSQWYWPIIAGISSATSS